MKDENTSKYWFLNDFFAWRLLWLWAAIAVILLASKYLFDVRLGWDAFNYLMPTATVSYVLGICDGRQRYRSKSDVIS
jgi:hypothetical protein